MCVNKNRLRRGFRRSKWVDYFRTITIKHRHRWAQLIVCYMQVTTRSGRMSAKYIQLNIIISRLLTLSNLASTTTLLLCLVVLFTMPHGANDVVHSVRWIMRPIYSGWCSADRVGLVLFVSSFSGSWRGYGHFYHLFLTHVNHLYSVSCVSVPVVSLQSSMIYLIFVTWRHCLPMLGHYAWFIFALHVIVLALLPKWQFD